MPPAAPFLPTAEEMGERTPPKTNGFWISFRPNVTTVQKGPQRIASASTLAAAGVVGREHLRFYRFEQLSNRALAAVKCRRGRRGAGGSDLSAASGGCSEVSEWQRSKFQASAIRQRRNFGHRNSVPFSRARGRGIHSGGNIEEAGAGRRGRRPLRVRPSGCGQASGRGRGGAYRGNGR